MPLVSLNVSACHLGSGGAHRISNLKSLKRLDISWNDIRLKGLEHIFQGLANLEELTISCLETPKDVMNELLNSNLSNLTSLNVIGRPLSDYVENGKDKLREKFPKLTKLNGDDFYFSSYPPK